MKPDAGTVSSSQPLAEILETDPNTIFGRFVLENSFAAYFPPATLGNMAPDYDNKDGSLEDNRNMRLPVVFIYDSESPNSR